MSDTIEKTGTDATTAYTYCTRHNIFWDRVQSNSCPSCASEAKGGLASEMVLRDWFAGQALAGLCACYGTDVFSAQDAYKLADAMLAARKEQP